MERMAGNGVGQPSECQKSGDRDFDRDFCRTVGSGERQQRAVSHGIHGGHLLLFWHADPAQKCAR